MLGARSYQRYNVELAATAQIKGQPRTLIIRNMSVGGALVVSQAPIQERLSPGTRIDIEFSLPELSAPVKTGATVRHTSAEGIGIQFDGLRAKEAYALGKFLDALPAPDSVDAPEPQPAQTT